VTDSSNPPQTVSGTSVIPNFTPITVNGVITPNTNNSNSNINLTASGSQPLTFSWSNGATTEDLLNVSPGVYSVTVSDVNNCISSASFTVLAQPQGGLCCKVKPNANPLADCSDSIMNLGNISLYAGHERCEDINQGNSCVWDFSNPGCCFPGAQGCGSSPGTTCSAPAISLAYPFSSLNVSTPGYSQLLQNCMNQAESSGFAQNYFCCVTLPGNLNLTASAKPSCKASASSIDLTVSGGTGPYTYVWSNGATTQDLNNILPGNYTVNVSSANGLTGTLTVNVPTVSPVNITAALSSASYPAYNNGSININVTPPVGYTYNWIKVGGNWPGSTNEDIQNLTPGSYTVTATNTYGCKASKTFKVQKNLNLVDPSKIIKKP
jgi:hypothetical protein